MVRWMIALCAVVVVHAGIAVASLADPADAQDRTDERLGELETRVAELSRRVDALEGGADNRAESGDSDELGGAAGTVRWSGAGEGVSDPFRLTPGRYRVSATVRTSGFDGFACLLYGPGDYWELVFNELIDAAGTWTGEAVVTVETAGDYYLETSNTGADWEIEVAPL